MYMVYTKSGVGRLLAGDIYKWVDMKRGGSSSVLAMPLIAVRVQLSRVPFLFTRAAGNTRTRRRTDRERRRRPAITQPPRQHAPGSGLQSSIERRR